MSDIETDSFISELTDTSCELRRKLGIACRLQRDAILDNAGILLRWGDGGHVGRTKLLQRGMW
jgi:hypothetical protein